MHEQGLPGLEPGPAVETEPAGLVPDVQGGGLGVVECLRCGQHGGGVGDGEFGESAAGQRRLGEDAGTGPGPGGVTGGDDLGADLDAGGEGQRWPDLVLAAAEQCVGEVDVGGADPQQQLPRAGHGVGHLIEAHHLARFAVLVYAPCLHPVASVNRSVQRRQVTGD